MRFRETERFKRSYKGLTVQDQERVKRALSLLLENRQHPSLVVKRVKGTPGAYEARASDAIRFTFHIEDDIYVLHVVGRHDDVLRRP